jgi:hypothetical protein
MGKELEYLPNSFLINIKVQGERRKKDLVKMSSNNQT